MLFKIPKPAVPKQWLYLIAGLIWNVAGIILIERALIWLKNLHTEQLIVVTFLGVVLGVIFYYSVFIKIARKNIKRIVSLPDQVCIFAFSAWKGYLIIIIMLTAGITLRHSAVSKNNLAVLYIAMGIALIMGSILINIHFFKNVSKGK